MKTALDKEPAWLLHQRPLGESQWILELWSQNFGRLALVYRPSKANPKPRAFQPLFLTGYFVSEGLGRLSHYDCQSAALPLQQDALFCGLYLNELLLKTFWLHQPSALLWQGYFASLKGLLSAQNRRQLEVPLRQYEWLLLQELGLTPSLQADKDGQPWQDHLDYFLYQNHWYPRPKDAQKVPGLVISGPCLSAWQSTEDFFHPQYEDCRQAQKKLILQLIQTALGGQSLVSREFFRTPQP